jgi:polyvinyl alcohol dehydrogenase (cytochrome)
MKVWTRIGIVAGAALVVSSSVLTSTAGATGTADWTMAGQNASNTRDNPAETTISASNVSGLKVKWSVTTNGDVIGNPAVSNGVAYFTDYGTSGPSMLWAVNANTGQVIWSNPISSYTGISGDASRNTPAVANGLLILGDRPVNVGTGAWMFAVNASTGKLAWKTEVESHPAAFITGSPSVADGLAIVGVSSLEEQLATQPGYACCTFRGSTVALNVATGQILWKTYLAPDNGGKTGGYSGSPVWSSTPVVDNKNGMVYVSTGNNYSVPASVCATPTQTQCSAPAPNDYLDSVVAMSIFSGVVIWSTKTLPSDVHNQNCIANPSLCGPDYDFGAGPNLYTATVSFGYQRDFLGIGQKSGMYYALDPNTGQVIWQNRIGPGDILGGIEWGTATDGNRIYAAEADVSGVPYTVNGKTITGGSWTALNAATGQIIWQTPDPQGAPDLGAVSTANGVVYAGSDAGTGNNMYALNAATGTIEWSYASGGSVVDGPSIVNGTVFWGSGYYIGAANDKLYAFGL